MFHDKEQGCIKVGEMRDCGMAVGFGNCDDFEQAGVNEERRKESSLLPSRLHMVLTPKRSQACAVLVPEVKEGKGINIPKADF